MHISRFKPDQFAKWLVAQGHEILTPTNEWEVVRFHTGTIVGIVYKNAAGNLKLTGPAGEAYEAYRAGKNFPALAKRKRKPTNVQLRTLIERDGCECFYCGRELETEEMTREHMLSVAHGGSNHISNLVIACQPCNQEADHLSIGEKVRLRESKRGVA